VTVTPATRLKPVSVKRIEWENAAAGKAHSASAISTAPILNFVFIVFFSSWAAAHVFSPGKAKGAVEWRKATQQPLS
jgi:hypothetical protein